MIRTAHPRSHAVKAVTAAQRLILAEQRKALENALYVQLRQRQAPEPEREYPFAAKLGRKYRADFAWPDLHVLAEVDGGTWSGGRHTRGAGFQSDCQKTNLAAALGWRSFRFTAADVHDESAANLLADVLGQAKLRLLLLEGLA